MLFAFDVAGSTAMAEAIRVVLQADFHFHGVRFSIALSLLMARGVPAERCVPGVQELGGFSINLGTAI